MLNLSGISEDTTSDGLADIVLNCNHLTSLNLGFCYEQVTDAVIRFLSENCKDIEKLDLTWCDKLTDEGMANIGKHCKKLKHLIIIACHQITRAGIDIIKNSCLELQYFKNSFQPQSFFEHKLPM